MRVVGGRHRGRPLAAPEGRWLRPTSDRAREAVFNILAHRPDVTIEGASVLDAFAGTGAMGIEALSRGAAHAIFMEADRRAVEILRRNLRALGEERNAMVLHVDCLTPPRAAEPCAIAFLDPPYGEDVAAPALAALAEAGWIGGATLCVVETGSRDRFAAPEGFAVIDERRYGAARVVLLTRA